MKKSLLLTILFILVVTPMTLADELKFGDDTSIEFGPDGIKVKHEEHEINVSKDAVDVKDKHSKKKSVRVETGNKKSPDVNTTTVKTGKGKVEIDTDEDLNVDVNQNMSN